MTAHFEIIIEVCLNKNKNIKLCDGWMTNAYFGGCINCLAVS